MPQTGSGTTRLRAPTLAWCRAAAAARTSCNLSKRVRCLRSATSLAAAASVAVRTPYAETPRSGCAAQRITRWLAATTQARVATSRARPAAVEPARAIRATSASRAPTPPAASPEAQCCPAANACGDTACCGDGQSCQLASSGAGVCCNTALCGDQCCAGGDVCSNGQCQAGVTCGSTVCGVADGPCCNGACCENGQQCVNGACATACPANEEACGSKCCADGTSCVNGECKCGVHTVECQANPESPGFCCPQLRRGQGSAAAEGRVLAHGMLRRRRNLLPWRRLRPLGPRARADRGSRSGFVGASSKRVTRALDLSALHEGRCEGPGSVSSAAPFSRAARPCFPGPTHWIVGVADAGATDGASPAVLTRRPTSPRRKARATREHGRGERRRRRKRFDGRGR